MNSTNCLYFSVRPFGITDFVRWSSSLAISLNASLTIATIISNAAVILTVVRFRELRTSSHLLIAFLALTDVSIGLFVQPLFIAFEILTLTRTTPACVVIVLYTVLRALFATMSQVTVLLISMEKTLAIFWPFRYRQIVRQRRIFITMAIVWCVWILVVSARFMGLETKTFRITVGVVIIACHALTGLAYVRIERLAAGHMKKIKQQLQSVSENNASWKAQVLGERKALRTTLYIIACMFLCYAPVVGVLLANIFSVYPPQYSHIMFTWADSFVYLSSIFNPAIYCMRNREFRRGCVASLVCCEQNAATSRRHEAAVTSITNVAFEMEAVGISKKSNTPVLLGVQKINKT